MPNYDKSVIYKISCNDNEIKDIYVGATTNFTNRKYQHKNCCNQPNNKLYEKRLYKFIRDNGGWENWTMMPIKTFSCNNKLELTVEERKIYEELGATLNSNTPMQTDLERKKYKYENKRKNVIKQKIIDYFDGKPFTLTEKDIEFMKQDKSLINLAQMLKFIK